MKRAFIIHGWGGYPEEAWFPWAKLELEKRGFEVEVPAMPDLDGNPEIERRVNFITQLVGEPDKNTFLIGHSIGCQSIIRYLETLQEKTRIGGAVFVCGWLTLKSLEDYELEDRQVAEPWIKTPIDFEKVRKICQKSRAIFTKDDEFVDLENADFYKERLGSEIVILESGEHLSESSGITELPPVIEGIERMSK